MPRILVTEEFVYLQNGSETPVKLSHVHSPEECAGRPCPFHNPTGHPMRDWDVHWRADRGILERICSEHRVGHPDPDGLYYHYLQGRKRAGVHGCCGCCGNSYEALEQKFFS